MSADRQTFMVKFGGTLESSVPAYGKHRPIPVGQWCCDSCGMFWPCDHAEQAFREGRTPTRRSVPPPDLEEAL